jgi:membrane protein required for colicin V production
MNLVDIFSLSLLLFMGGKGLYRGFVEEIFTLGALIVAGIASFYLYQPVSNFINSQLGWESPWTSVISFIILFIVINLAVRLLGEKIEEILDHLRLSFANRLAGLGIGALKAFLIVFLLTSLLVRYPILPDLSAYIEDSISYDIISYYNPFSYVTNEINEQIDELIEHAGRIAPGEVIPSTTTKTGM